MVLIDFSAAFDRVLCQKKRILFKLCFVGVVISVLSVLTPFLPNWSQSVVVDGSCSNWLTWCQGCLREVIWVCSCSSCTPSGALSILENKLYGYADDSTLMSVLPSPAERLADTVFES